MCMVPIAGTITTNMTTTTTAILTNIESSRLEDCRLVGAATTQSALPLFLWLSPAFPVGAYAYSHGLEWAAEAGDLGGAAALAHWLDDLCDFGAPRLDVVVFAAAHRSAIDDLPDLNALAVALAGSRERRLETTAQGAAFVTAARSAWPCAALDVLGAQARSAYPVAVGAAARGHGVALEVCGARFRAGAVFQSGFGRDAPQRDRADRGAENSRPSRAKGRRHGGGGLCLRTSRRLAAARSAPTSRR